MKNTTHRIVKLALSSLIAVSITACSNLQTGAGYRPIVDGINNQGDLSRYEFDLKECQGIASQREYLNDDAKSDAAIGAVLGALAGSGGDRGDILGGAVAGAFIGGGAKVYEARDERKNIVIKCMHNRGYNTLESNR